MYYRKQLVQKILVIAASIMIVCICCCSTKKNISVAEDERSCFEQIYLSKNVDPMQKVKLFQRNENDYYVFMPSEMLYETQVYFETFYELQIGNVTYKSGDVLTDIRSDSPLVMSAMTQQGEIVEEGTIKFFFSIGVPSVYIETDSGTFDNVNAQRDVKENIQYATITEDGMLDCFGHGTIKARGNTSFHAEQKSYSMNLSSQQSLLGLETASEWALVANYENTVQQLKNKIVLDLAEILEMPHTPDCKFVNIYLNNQYNGMYLLAQKVSADGGSVHLEKEGAGNNLSGPYLLEFDARYEREPVWFKTNTKNVVVKYPKVITEESLEYISNYLKKAEDAISSSEALFCKDYIDIDSWTSMYLMQEFFVQQDVEFASFYLYKYADDPLIYAGPVWDFDLAYGRIYHGWYEKTTQQTVWLDERGGWLGTLDDSEWFQEMLIKKYYDKFAPSLQIYMDEELPQVIDTVVYSSWMNSQRWNRGETDIWTDAEQLIAWMSQRKNFMDDYMANKESYHKVAFHMDWGTINYYVKDKQKLGFLPTEDYGEVASVNNPIEWQNADENSVGEELIITEEIDLYAVYE